MAPARARRRGARSAWVRSAFTALCLLAAVSNGGVLLRNLRAPRGPIGADPVTVYLRRFDVLRQDLQRLLPATAEVGYLTDCWDVRDYQGVGIADWELCRYALRPLRVSRAPDGPLVAGNFVDPAAAAAAARAGGLRLVRDYGDGVLLFAGENR